LRAKCCNLLGNLCRHNQRFYTTLGSMLSAATAPSSSSASPSKRAIPLVNYLIQCISAEDAVTRKFACFAVGNAAFHSDELYPLLESAIAPLAVALSDADEKTRANAAGAIGNFVRNSGYLAGRLADEGVPEKLLLLIFYDKDIATQVNEISSQRMIQHTDTCQCYAAHCTLLFGHHGDLSPLP
jgi:fused